MPVRPKRPKSSETNRVEIYDVFFYDAALALSQ
jgi:hypothetical protein